MSAKRSPVDEIERRLVVAFEEAQRVYDANVANSKWVKGAQVSIVTPEPEKTESPLERRMFEALSTCGFTREDSERPGIARLYQQMPVVTHLGAFRIDLAAIRRVDKFVLKLAIEADGHDFHHADKQQVERDCRRDRALVRAGWRVLRFPGSEIHRDADACALEVAGIVIEWVDLVSVVR